MSVNKRNYSFNERKKINKSKQVENPFTTAKEVKFNKLTDKEVESIVDKTFEELKNYISSKNNIKKEEY